MPAPRFSLRSTSALGLVGLALGLGGCGEANQRQAKNASAPADVAARAPAAGPTTYASGMSPLPAAKSADMGRMGMMGGPGAPGMGGGGQAEFLMRGMGKMIAPGAPAPAAEPPPSGETYARI